MVVMVIKEVLGVNWEVLVVIKDILCVFFLIT